MAARREVTIVVQVNGKVRDRIQMPAGVGEADVQGARTGESQARRPR